MFNKTYHATHPDMMEGVSNEQLRERYIVSGLLKIISRSRRNVGKELKFRRCRMLL